eukprot:scaffold568394_cov15-Prasinocladus_malaysianus.AAC.1
MSEMYADGRWNITTRLPEHGNQQRKSTAIAALLVLHAKGRTSRICHHSHTLEIPVLVAVVDGAARD